MTELTHHLQTAREDERSRLARDLHDELGALLTSAKLDAARIKSRLAGIAPEAIDCVLIETPVPNVPYGVRGVAEMPIVPVAAAVGNAIRRAIGVRMTQMPMTPERIVSVLNTIR